MPAPAPTLVSTFEILFTPQLPPGLGPSAVAKVDELVVKGYFLTISNPNPAAYTFDLGFHCNVNPTPVPAIRTLASAVGFLDDGTTGSPLSLNAATSGVDFFATVRVAARGTVLVGILPAFFTASGLAAATIECRGWVDITLPALLGGRPIEFVAQSATPVTAILTPEQRLTFLPMTGDASTAVEAQSAFALPPATGAGGVAIPPQPGGPLRRPEPGPLTAAQAERLRQFAGSATPAELAAMLDILTAAPPP